MIRASALGCILVFATIVAAQSTSSSISKDPKALAVIQTSLASMGCSQALAASDSLATGTVQIYKADGTIETVPIVKKSMGTTLTRTELHRPSGTTVRILNNGQASRLRPDGSTRYLIRNNTVAERVQHIPCLSLLQETQNPIIDVQYVGSDTVNGDPVDEVALSRVSNEVDARATALMKAATRTVFYISRANGTVDKMQYQNIAENNTNISDPEEVLFSDYRSIGGTLVPFTQATYEEGTLRTVITFTSVAFNTGLSETEFTVRGAK